MTFRISLLSLLLVPGLASFSTPRPVTTTVDATDAALVRTGGILLRDRLPYTGHVVERDADGGVVTNTTYRDGLRDGAADAWYANGQRSYHRTYWQGREDGEHTGWWEDGRVRFSYQYRRGLIEGAAREWFRDGKLYREYHYAAGREEGSQQMWWADGTLRANYVIRNGRRYGLPGVKGCAGLDTAVVSRES